MFRAVRAIPIALLVLLTGAALAGCGSSEAESSGEGTADSPTTLRVAETTLPSVTSFPVHAAQELGFAKDHGIKFEFVQSDNHTTLVASGKAEVLNGPAAGLLAALQGAPIVAVEIAAPYPIGGVYAEPGVQTAKDLEGKTIATTGSTVVDTLVKAWFEKEGADPGKVTFIKQTGNVASALLTGSTEAAFLTSPSEMYLAGKDFNKIGDLTNPEAPFPFAGISVTDTFLEENPEVVEDAVAAVNDALAYLRDDANEEKSIALMRAYMDIDEGTEGFEDAFRAAVESYDDDGKVSTDAASAMIRTAQNLAGADEVGDVPDYFAPSSLE